MPFFDHYPYTNLHNVNLDWVLQKVKDWGAEVEYNNQRFENLKEANDAFKLYVTGYLHNLDVQDEINTKLDDMLASGELLPYLRPYIRTEVTDWLSDHITPTTPPIDSSLSIAGAAADAEAAGNAINEVRLSLNSITIYSDPVDIKKEMYTGSQSTNVGIGNTITINPTTSTAKYKIVPCIKGDKFYVKGTETNSYAKVWALTDENYVLYAIASQSTVDETITAQMNGYAIFNLSLNSYNAATSALDVIHPMQVSNRDVIEILSQLGEEDITSNVIRGKALYLDKRTGTVIDVNALTTSTTYGYIVVPILAGEQVTITGTGGGSPRLWAFMDTNYVLQRVSNASITETDLTLTALQDGYFAANFNVSMDYEIIIHRYVALDKMHTVVSDDTEIVSLLDFEAVRDGVTDDTAAINNALTAAAGRILYVPEGEYLFSGTLNVHSGTTIIGCGESSVFKLADTFTLTPYDWRPEDGGLSSYKWAMMLLDDQSSGCILKNFKIEGQTAAFVDQAEIALTVRGSNHIIENVITENINYFPDDFSGRQYNAPGEGIELFKSSKIKVSNCICINCGYEGIGTESTTDAIIENCTVKNTNQTGIQIHRSSQRIKVNGCNVEYDDGIALAGAALTFHANVGVDMRNIWVTNSCFDKGITLIGGAENYVYLLNNTIKSGAFTRNGDIYRQNWVIKGNQFLGGGIVNQIDNCIITDNMLTVNTGYQMINMKGNNVIAANNIALGSVSGIHIETHE